ncbi:MAG: NADH-quinone oxidoreductase subunit NuoK [bacterium]
MIPLHHILILAAVLFSIGLYGVLVRRNMIGILMSIELMLNAANINLVAFSRYLQEGAFSGQVFVVFTITVAAAEAAVALAIVLTIYRQRKTIKMDEINLMKW